MANPFYWNHCNPIRHAYYPQSEAQTLAIRPKSIRIPVHFVGSDGDDIKARSAAALTIQRAVRGFLVRKNARLVRQVAAEVEEMERKLREEGSKIRSNNREWLRVSETLMALLLRLDSVRGVRDFRKTVIRRIIALQEAIDSISASESSIDRETATDHLQCPLDLGMSEGGAESAKKNSDLVEVTAGDDEREAAEEMESIPSNRIDERVGDEEEKKNSSDGIGIAMAEEPSMALEEGSLKADAVSGREEGRGMREMVEKMAVENESLNRMVVQLCATSSQQRQLMEGLVGRIEQLERTVHRLDRRKKRRSSAACPALHSK